MTNRLSVAVLAAALFTVTGTAALLSSAAPARADQDDHRRPQHHHAMRSGNPYGATGYWSHGSWHRRAPVRGNHLGWNVTHPAHPTHPRHPDRDRH